MATFSASFTYKLIDHFSKKARVMGRNALNLEKSLNRSGAAFDRLEHRYAAASRAVRNSAKAIKNIAPPDPKKWDKSTDAVERFGRSHSRAIGGGRSVAPIGGGGAVFGGFLGAYAGKQAFDGTIGNALNREHVFAGVEKVLADGLSDAAIKGLRTGVSDLTRTIPRSFAELSSIMEAAAQAGTKTEDLLRFTEFTGKAATAFDMLAGNTGEAFAKIRNIFKLSQGGIESYADSVNHLSNNMSSSASQIIEFTKNAASAGPALNVTSQEIAAVGSSLIALGAIPSFAARSIRKLGTVVQAVAGGHANKKQTGAFGLLDIDFKKWKKLYEKDGKAALQSLFNALNKSAQGDKALLDLVGLEHIGTLGRLKESPEQLAIALGLVADKIQYAGSVTEEFKKKAATNKNKIQLMFNSISAAAAAFGAQFTDSIGNTANLVADFLNTSDQRVSIFDKISSAYKGFINGLGFKKGGVLKSILTGIFGDTKTFEQDADGLAKSWKSFSEIGGTVKYVIGLMQSAGGAISGFFGSIEKIAGFQAGAIGGTAKSFVAWALGLTFGIKALVGVASFAARLTGLSLIFRTLMKFKKIKGVDGTAKEMGLLGRGIKAIWAGIKSGVPRAILGLAAALKALSLLALTPVGAAITVIAVAMGGVYAAYKNWDAIVAGMKSFGDSIVQYLGAAADNVKQKWEAFKAVFETLRSYFKEKFTLDIGWPEMPSWLKSLWGGGSPTAANDNVAKQVSGAKGRKARRNALRVVNSAPVSTSPAPSQARPDFQTEVTATVKSDVHARFDPARIDVDVNVQGPSAIPITVNGQQQGSASLSASSNQPRGKNLPVSTTIKNGGATSHAKAS